MNPWLLLAVAIGSEVVATSALKASDGFTRLWPALIVVAGYAVSFFFMALALRYIPIGIVYAVWAGVGIVLIASVGWLLFGQQLDVPALAGMLLIVSGVVVIRVFSKAADL